MSNVVNLQAERCGLRPALGVIVFLVPLVLLPSYAGLLSFPATEAVTLASLRRENGLVERLTFAFLLLGGIRALRLAIASGRRPGGRGVALFLAAMGGGLIVVAMEEVSWGQHLFGLKTPSYLIGRNRQNEINLHNLGGLQGYSEVFHLLWGLVGLVGLVFPRGAAWEGLRVARVLSSWFLAIFLFAALDLSNDFVPFGEPLDDRMRWMSEVVELMIGASAFLHVWFVAHSLGGRRGPETAGRRVRPSAGDRRRLASVSMSVSSSPARSGKDGSRVGNAA